MSVMDRGPHATIHRNRGLSQLNEVSIKYLGSVLSLATGCLCVALAAIYDREGDKAALIVMACSNLFYGLGFFIFCLLYSKMRGKMNHFTLGQLGCILIELITLGAAVYYFDHGRKHNISPDTILHQNLLTALDSLLLFTLFVNGMAIASFKLDMSFGVSSAEEVKHLECDSGEQHGKFVPLKNSSQTLTPSMEIFQNIQSQCGSKPWTMNNESTIHSSDDTSFPSVVKHKLDCLSSKEASPVSSISRKASSIKSRLRSSSGGSSPKRSRSLISKLRRKKSNTNETTNKNIDGRYVTRLSTIPDLSKSVLNFILSSSETQAKQEKVPDSTPDQNIRHSSTQPDPALELERNAIERINSALLPPCLRTMETPPPPEREFVEASRSVQFGQFGRSTHSSPNDLEINDLGEIPQILAANHDSSSGCSNFGLHEEFPQLVTMDMWRQNKDKILQRADHLQHRTLLPAFDLNSRNLANANGLEESASYSFPSRSHQVNLDSKSNTGKKDIDTISALEEYFRDLNEHEEEEVQIIQDGLKHELTSSSTAAGISKELVRISTRHSPTKSIISVISAASQQRSQTVRNSYLNMTGDQRPHSQGNFFLPTSSTGILSASGKTSPTRSQRLKRIGKKLSLSNISDTMISHSIASDTTGDLFATSKHDHMRGRSIDFSYVHNLQSNHSPTKSTSGQSMCGSIYNDRRHSLAADHGLRTASGLFLLQNGNSTVNLGADPTINTTWNEPLSEDHDSSHSASTDTSNKSATNYPDVVVSEYDRERWNTLLSLQMIDSRGQAKV